MKKETFGEKIKNILKQNGYNYKIRYEPKGESFRRGKKVVCDYDKITIYAGRSIEKIAQKRSTEPLKYVMYSDCDWDDNEEYAKNKMLKILENWKFVEKERQNLNKPQKPAI